MRDAIIGVSEKMLIQNLRELERDGIVHREAYKQVPPKVEYSLTPMGKTTIPIMRAQFERGKRYASRLVAGEELEPGDVLQDIEERGGGLKPNPFSLGNNCGGSRFLAGASLRGAFCAFWPKLETGHETQVSIVSALGHACGVAFWKSPRKRNRSKREMAGL